MNLRKDLVKNKDLPPIVERLPGKDDMKATKVFIEKIK